MKKLIVCVMVVVWMVFGCNISGEITKDGVGLQGITVQVEKEGVVVGTTQTGVDGTYSFDMGDDTGAFVVRPLGLYSFTPEKRTVAMVSRDVSGVNFTAQLKMWNKTYGDNVGYSIQQTTDGGYILAGYTSAGGKQAWLIKIDANGNEEWNKTFGGSYSDYAQAVQQTTDGGYILAGTLYSYSTGYEYRDADFRDAMLIKTDAFGNEEWSRSFWESKEDGVASVQQTTDGGYIIAGYTYSSGKGYDDAWLIKTDANGNANWKKTYGGSGFDQANSIQQTTDGGYVFAGYLGSWDDNQANYWLVKTDENGNEEWNNTYGGSYGGTAYSVQQTTDGGYIIAGDLYYEANVSHAFLVKTDANGNEEWNKTFGESNSNRAQSVKQTTDGGYIIAGRTWSDVDSDTWLVKTDANGNEEWSKTFSGDTYIYCSAAIQSTDGGYVLAGAIGFPNLWVVKTDEHGNTTPLPQ